MTEHRCWVEFPNDRPLQLRVKKGEFGESCPLSVFPALPNGMLCGLDDFQKRDKCPVRGRPQRIIQRLRSRIDPSVRARDTMRKDRGLNDLDRLSILTWIMFLKFLDDLENVR